jgi:hypothetical protein
MGDVPGRTTECDFDHAETNGSQTQLPIPMGTVAHQSTLLVAAMAWPKLMETWLHTINVLLAK